MFFDVHTHNLEPQKSVLSIINQYPNDPFTDSFFSVGIHPWYISEKKLESEFDLLEKKLVLKNCLALGECGLDKLSRTNYGIQINVFKRQIELSEKTKKPLIIHCVKAYNDIIVLRKQLKPQQPWILHGFNKSLQVAQDLLKNDICISLGSALLTNRKLQTIVTEINSSKILLETDNSKESITDIYNTFASIKNENIELVIKQINKNFNKIFIV
ncbi:TatD DNase family protein [Tenacibaculum sp. MAR_2009_124]|uniref:TatD family hydrolase n=1 Tax=Tenacibaculum sp. MAR_2009_124 TaxID=1250059 RepID=UPI000899ADBD|nr:TatD family hydrolase [Tenacibaculum sp. MAR_2009_124]SED13178.1 TatD DNase family protein [Tenacibaculum sp. MAR_2009_124]